MSPPADPKAVRRRELLKLWGPILLLVAAGFAVAFSMLEPAPPRRFALATGSADGAYHAFGERYRQVLAREGYELEVRVTAGSVENLALLREGQVELALVQGGTVSEEDSEQLEALAGLFLEPVWVFHRAELEVERLTQLAGRRLGVGAAGSGTRALALRLLADNRIGEDDADLQALSSAAAAEALVAGELDAAFFVSSIDSAYVGRLLREPEVRLFPFTRSPAYRYRHRFLQPVTLAEGGLDLAANQPEQDVPLLASAASLAARRDLPPALIPLLLNAMQEVHGDGGVFEEPGAFPTPALVELPMSAAARYYLENGPSFLHRYLSFRVASAIDRLKILLLPFLTLLIPLFRVAPPLYRWRIRSRIYRWYEDLHRVDDALHGEPPVEEIDRQLAHLERLEREVANAVSVPLSYMDEYYRLRQHIHLTAEKLAQRRTRVG